MMKLMMVMLFSMFAVIGCSSTEDKSAGEAKAKALYDRAKAASKEAHQDLGQEVDKLRR